MSSYEDRQLDALGDPTRRAILERLRNGPLPVGSLAEGFPISRPAISQHLRILKEAQLVMDHAQGTRRYYAIDPAGFAAARHYLDLFWAHALHAFQQQVESQEE